MAFEKLYKFKQSRKPRTKSGGKKGSRKKKQKWERKKQKRTLLQTGAWEKNRWMGSRKQAAEQVFTKKQKHVFKETEKKQIFKKNSKQRG